MNKDVHQKYILVAFGGDHSKRAFQCETGEGELLPRELHPAFGCKTAVQVERELPEWDLGAKVALHKFHVVTV